ncbi:NRAMP family divalent metal transporter [Aestuariivivens marinum]|uniref:NRAMP family divalent metal transporter n=1 Tax=Aestuariivivens marinum TaxID=2913555 RepID=UPI001F576D95|nr:divalent metal cation transporter [Aestuariivivens marinum]
MNWEKIKKTLGPGILFASTAIGVSHLVQSTRAGANFGFGLVLFIIAANVFKFPFFEFGARYANATGKTLIDGYKRLGNYAIWIYFLVTICSMFFVSAAVVLVTTGFMDNLFGLSVLWPTFNLFPIALVFLVTVSLLMSGKYNFLDHFIKIVGIVLLISTLIVFILTLINGPAEHVEHFIHPHIFDDTSIMFIIALMGWMPTAMDMSTWVSLWTVAKMKSSNYHPTLKETLFDFNFGYWVSAFLSLCFVTIGAYLIYGTGKTLPAGSVGFADGVIKLYTTTIGDWSYLIIATAAFSIMFGTCIGLFDGYARTLQRTTTILFAKNDNKETDSRNVYIWSLVILAIGSFAINAFFSGQFKILIDLATTISFLIAPLVAVANFKLVSSKYIDKAFLPGKLMKLISWLGILFLTGFAFFYMYVKFLK